MLELYLKRNETEYLLENQEFKLNDDLIGWENLSESYSPINWYINNNRAYHIQGQDSSFQQYIDYEYGETYVVELDVAINYGELTLLYGNGSQTITQSGYQKIEITISSGTLFGFNGDVDFYGYINYVRLYKKTTDIVKYYQLYIDEMPSLTVNRNDIERINQLKSSYTLDSYLQGNSNNNKILSNLFNLDVYQSNNNLNENIQCELYYNSKLLIDGIFTLKEIEYQEHINNIRYKFILNSKLKLLGELLSDFKLIGNNNKFQDISFSEYNHLLTLQNIADSWSNEGSGYYYPVAKYTDFQNNVCYAKDLRPSLFWKEIVDKIFEKIGKTYTSTFFESDFFNNLICPFVNNKLSSADDFEEFNCQASTSYDHEYNINSNQNLIVDIELDDDSSLDNFDNGDNFNTTTYTYTADKSGLFNINSKLTHQVRFGFLNIESNRYYWYGNSYIKVRILIYKNDEIIAQNYMRYALPSDYVFNYETSDLDYIYDEALLTLDIPDLELQVGDEVKMKMKLESSARLNPRYDGNTYTLNGSASDGQMYIYVKVLEDDIVTNLIKGTKLKFTQTESDYVYYGYNVDANSILPDMTRLDVLSNICNLFNLVIDEDKDNPDNYIIETWDDYFNSGSTKNWTNKLDRNLGININNPTTFIDNNLIMTYSSDNDYLNNNYLENIGDVFGTKKVYNDNQTINNKELKLMFAPTPSVRQKNTSLILPCFYSQNDSNESEYKKLKPRILNRFKYDFYSDEFLSNDLVGTNGGFTILGPLGNSGATLNCNSYIYSASNFDIPYSATTDLNFGPAKKYYHPYKSVNDNIYNKYWKNRINDLISSDGRYLKCKMYLTDNDILNWNFNDKIIIDGNIFYIDSIENWNGKNLVNVNLIKILDQALLYNPEDDVDNVRDWDFPIYVPRLPILNPINITVPTIPDIPVLSDVSNVINTGVSLIDNQIADNSPSINLGERNIINGDFNLVIGEANLVSSNQYSSIQGSSNSVKNSSSVSIQGNNNNVDGIYNSVIIGNELSPNDDNSVFVGGDNIYLNKEPQKIINIIDGMKNKVLNPFNPIKQTHIINGMKDTTRTNLSSYDSTYVVSSNVDQYNNPFNKFII